MQVAGRSERYVVQVDGRLVQRVAASQAEQVGCDAKGDSPQREGWRLLQFARALPPARRVEGAWCVMCVLSMSLQELRCCEWEERAKAHSSTAGNDTRSRPTERSSAGGSKDATPSGRSEYGRCTLYCTSAGRKHDSCAQRVAAISLVCRTNGGSAAPGRCAKTKVASAESAIRCPRAVMSRSGSRPRNSKVALSSSCRPTSWRV